jgi:hypothetical protein
LYQNNAKVCPRLRFLQRLYKTELVSVSNSDLAKHMLRHGGKNLRKNKKKDAAMSATTHTCPREARPVRLFMSGLARRAGRLIARFATAVAEQRAHRALIEAELYLNRYAHSSKNDDDLPITGLPVGGSPIAEQPPAEQPAPSPRAAWRRFTGAAVTIAKRIYPALIVLSLLATVLAATTAIRVAIWLPSRLF